MTKHKGKAELIDVKELLQRDEDFLRAALQGLAQAALEAEMTETIGAAKGERTETRLAYRSGYYSRSLITRVGTLELRVPQDRDGRFSTELFQRYQRSEKALVGTPGRDVRAGCVDPQGQGGDRGVVRPRLLGLGDQHHQQVVGPSPEGVCRATPGGAVPVSDPGRPLRAGARGRGHPQPGGVDRGGGRWRGPAPGARRRSCQPGEPDELARFSVGDQGARPVWRRVRRLGRSRRSAAGDPRGPAWCSLAALLCVHFLRNALGHLPRKLADDCLQELRWIYDRRELVAVRRDIAAWLAKWQAKHSKLCDWVEENIEETLSYYRLPLAHHKHMKSTNMLERFNQELKRRTHVVRIFPNSESCLRLVRALAVETHENWLEGTRYLNMQHLAEHKKEALRQAA